MAKRYFYLMERNEDGKWGVAFGDYAKADVAAEREYYRDQGVKAKDLKIVQGLDTQASGDAITTAWNAD